MRATHSRRQRSIAIALTLLLAGPATASVRLVGDLPRAGGRALEDIAGVDTEYGDLRMQDGARIRTIVTKPARVPGRLPAIAFVHWLSCDSVDFGAGATDGWSMMLKRIIRESGFLVQRIDKSGVGDSTGTSCDQLGYEAELAQHRAALDALLARADVDPARVVIFGASMGSNYAPLLAVGRPVAGVIVWGGGASTWFERTLLFERHALELGGTDPGRLSPEMTARAAFLVRYLVRAETPEAIARDDAELGRVWARLIETRGATHYGRPLSFDQQAQQQNWPAAWVKVSAPVLALYGEYDWFESPDSARLVADLVNRAHPGRAEFVLIPATDHHFTRYPSREAAFREQGGVVDVSLPVERMLDWLRRSVR